MSDISVLGAGNMGAALVRAFVNAGTTITVWNRTRSKAEALTGPGVTLADSAADAFANNPCSILCLSSYANGRELLEQSVPLSAGTRVIQLTTGTPADAREFSRLVAASGADYLDGAIMGVPNIVGKPQNLVLWSGDEATFDALRPLLTQLGTPRYLGADPGAAAAFDIAALMAVFPMVLGLLQGLKVCELESIAAEHFDGFVRDFLQLSVTDTLDKVRREGYSADPAQAEVSVAQVAATVALIADYCREVHLDPALFETLTSWFRRGASRGFENHDWVTAADWR